MRSSCFLRKNAETLLPTIRSRCGGCSEAEEIHQGSSLVKTVSHGSSWEIPDYKADVCVAFAQGNMGKAIMLANSEYFNEIKEEAVHLLRNRIDEIDRAGSDGKL